MVGLCVVSRNGQWSDAAAILSPQGPVHAAEKAGNCIIFSARANVSVMLGRQWPQSLFGN